MSLVPGCQLGPYEILAPLGSGGMGEVWKARDTRLNRIVARAIAALNHPNICQIHDIGPDYLVLEFIDEGLSSAACWPAPSPPLVASRLS